MHQSRLYFNQDCPCCGRGMRVRIELLGSEIICSHCTAVTVACEEQVPWWVGLVPESATVINSIALREKRLIRPRNIQPIV